MMTKIYMSEKGRDETPHSTEYRLQDNLKLLFVYNATSVDKQFVMVENEKEPVIMVYLDGSNFCEFISLNSHLSSDACNGRVQRVKLQSSSIGAQLITRRIFVQHICRGIAISIRRGDLVYEACSTPELAEKENQISFKDLMAFAAKDISWEDLADRSRTCVIERAEETSQAEVIDELKTQMQISKDNISQGISSVNGMLDDLEKEDLKWRVVPLWIRNVFTWWDDLKKWKAERLTTFKK